MKREFLKAFNLEDSVITQIMAENGKDVEAAKGDTEALKQQITAKDTEITGLKEQIGQRDKDIEALRTSAASGEAFKTQLDELQSKYTADTTALQKKLDDQKEEYESNAAMEKFFAGVEFSSSLAKKAAIAEFKGQNFKRSGDTFQGGKEWLEALKKDSPEAFKPENNPDNGGNPPPAFSKSLQNPSGGAPANGGAPAGNGWNFAAVRNIEQK